MKPLFTQFKNILADYGLEWFNKYYGVYRGSVADNQDPEFMGRIKVNCPAIYGDEVPDFWAFPRGMWGGDGYGAFVVPQPGDPVYITFENGDAAFPLWEYGWYYQGKTPAQAKRQNPNIFMIQTPAGLRAEMDDQEGLIRFTNKAGFTVELLKEGIRVKNSAGLSLHDIIKNMNTEISKLKVNTPVGPSTVPLNFQQFLKLAQETSQVLA